MKLNHKVIAVLLLIVLAVSLIPVLYLSGYVHATGDDYGYGYRTHHAWLDTRSLLQVFTAAADTVKVYWKSWQGTWFTIFCMTFQPEVFSKDAYWIVPWMMLTVIFVSTSLVLYEFLVRKMNTALSTFWSVVILVYAAMVHFFPSTKSGIFWYNGTTHYIIPYGLAMIAVYCFLRYAEHSVPGWFLGALICMTALGGSSYLAALLAPIILIYIWIWYGKKNKKVFWLAIPLALEGVGLYISFIAPGNAVRGGADFGLGFDKVILTILQCFIEGVKTFGIYLCEKPAAVFALILAAVLVFDCLVQQEKAVCRFRYPLLFSGLMFATWCAMFAPGLYAGVEVSGGVPNMIWQIFVLTFLACLVYWAGWLAAKIKERAWTGPAGKLKGYIYIGVLFIGMIWVYMNKGTIKETTFFTCYEFISSGQADDYNEQMEERLAILLDDSIKEAELPAMNSEQGPFMHMEVLQDPEAWTNSVVKQFYRKEKVVEVPRQ